MSAEKIEGGGRGPHRATSYFVILGGGKFGKHALRYAVRKNFGVIAVVDKDEDAPAFKDGPAGYRIIDAVRDGIPIEPIHFMGRKEKIFLRYNIDLASFIPSLEKAVPEYIVPVIPIHILAYTVKYYAEKTGYRYIPPGEKHTVTIDARKIFKILLGNIPQYNMPGYSEYDGVIFLSWARKGEICPENCTGPPGYCPHFKRKKPYTIGELIDCVFRIAGSDEIGSLSFDTDTMYIALPSIQLAGGLGAFSGPDFVSTVQKSVRFLRTSEKPFGLIICASYCNCHGIINILPFIKNIK